MTRRNVVPVGSAGKRRFAAIDAWSNRGTNDTISNHRAQWRTSRGHDLLIRAYVICALIAASAVPANADNWPVFRHDNQRSGRTPEDLASSALREVWTYRSLTPPVPAWPAPARWDAYAYIRGLRAMRDYDRVFHTISVGDLTWFASSADDSVHCLDARTGEQRWQFWTDGPIRMAPTYADGRLYFGSDDGHAYCVDAERGELI